MAQACALSEAEAMAAAASALEPAPALASAASPVIAPEPPPAPSLSSTGTSPAPPLAIGTAYSSDVTGDGAEPSPAPSLSPTGTSPAPPPAIGKAYSSDATGDGAGAPLATVLRASRGNGASGAKRELRNDTCSRGSSAGAGVLPLSQCKACFVWRQFWLGFLRWFSVRAPYGRICRRTALGRLSPPSRG